MRLLLATSNTDKVAEWRRIAPDVDWVAVAGLPSPDETGATCGENARIKARAAAATTGWRALGDDVGLWVDALGGRPGVDLKPWAESLGGWPAARAALAALAGSPATYRCGLALCGPDGVEVVVEGAVTGWIGPPRGAGPGVEPCFRPGDGDRTLSECSDAERARLHHRWRAWAALRAAVEAGDAARYGAARG